MHKHRRHPQTDIAIVVAATYSCVCWSDNFWRPSGSASSSWCGGGPSETLKRSKTLKAGEKAQQGVEVMMKFFTPKGLHEDRCV